MFAVVANGIQTICKTQRKLDCILAIYPYPKFQKCSTEAEALRWLRENSRGITSIRHELYGNTAKSGYVRLEYFIQPDGIYYNIFTEKAGFIRIPEVKGLSVDSRPTLLKVIVSDTKLDNSLIAHHIIAIRRALRFLGEYIDVDIMVPDISVFLAITKYSGKDYVIRGLQKDIARRLGGVSVTIKEEK